MSNLSILHSKLDQAEWRARNSKLRACCPFHKDDTPSMLINPTRYRCMGCGVSGLTKNLLRRMEGEDIPRKYRRAGVVSKSVLRRWKYTGPKLPLASNLAGLEAIAMEAHETLIDNEGFDHYLRKRGIADRIVPQMLGWRAGWYTIPVFGRRYEFSGLILRATPAFQATTDLRYTQPKGTRAMCYVPDWKLLDSSEYLVIVYGMIDALSLVTLGIPAMTTTGGAVSFDPNWLDAMRKSIIIMPDKYEGLIARELAADLGWRGNVFVYDYPMELKDPNDLLVAGLGDKIRKGIKLCLER